MVSIAKESDAKLKIMVVQIKKDYGIINVDAKIYLSACKECQVAKIKAMRSPLAGSSAYKRRDSTRCILRI